MRNLHRSDSYSIAHIAIHKLKIFHCSERDICIALIEMDRAEYKLLSLWLREKGLRYYIAVINRLFFQCT